MIGPVDDEGDDRRLALDLFDASGSAEKTLRADRGGYTGIPAACGRERRALLRASPLPAVDDRIGPG
ncbi:hypothetical protein [Microbacterium ulmi]|uniref:hypothetical protein n=1 Tax=Microbacterium ulmi TaxID=179095 RepID=UPI001FBB1566|nr:hypothetical protein [Microbacterium ulmi]NII68752.1 hypothetical protein [Microbacterium ulmi]